jgi:hypothetical protein
MSVDPLAALCPTYGAAKTSFYLSKEGTAAWSCYFKPDGSIINSVTVPAQWADFFTAKLLPPEDFDWDKSLL